MERVLVALGALVYAGIGIAALIDPVAVLAPAEVTATGPGGVIELRAMYGGMELGVAAFLIWTLIRPQYIRAGLVACTLSIGTLGLVRTAGWITAQPEGLLLPLLCTIELSALAIGGAALWQTRSR